LFVDQDQRLAVALMDRARPVDVYRKAQAVQPDIVGEAVLDVPRPSAFAFAFRRRRVEVAGTPPIAVARDQDLSIETPALRHIVYLIRRLTALPSWSTTLPSRARPIPSRRRPSGPCCRTSSVRRTSRGCRTRSPCRSRGRSSPRTCCLSDQRSR